MKRQTDHKIILVTRPTRLAELVARHNTPDQARFYIEHLGADFSDYEREDLIYREALGQAQRSLDQLGRVQIVDRQFLPNFVFAPEDTVVVLGQDGLVANTVKYLDGQLVVGINPDPARWEGQLLPFRVNDLPHLMPEVLMKTCPLRAVTMARARLNNGQILHAVNDLFIGPRSHVSARYEISLGERSEVHSSSGVIVSTGVGSSGWLKSLVTGAVSIAQNIERTNLGSAKRSNNSSPGRRGDRKAAKPKAIPESGFPWDAEHLCYTVREPFPTKTTGAGLVFGRVTREQPLVLVSHMADYGVIFSDGIEKDYLEFNSGARAEITLADKQGQLVV